MIDWKKIKGRKNRSVAFYHDRRLSRSGANLECKRSHIAIVVMLT
jgi:hypothetical protein